MFKVVSMYIKVPSINRFLKTYINTNMHKHKMALVINIKKQMRIKQ